MRRPRLRLRGEIFDHGVSQCNCPDLEPSCPGNLPDPHPPVVCGPIGGGQFRCSHQGSTPEEHLGYVYFARVAGRLWERPHDGPKVPAEFKGVPYSGEMHEHEGAQCVPSQGGQHDDCDSFSGPGALRVCIDLGNGRFLCIHPDPDLKPEQERLWTWIQTRLMPQ